MSNKSKIPWTDKVWNPTTGCSKVSPACDNCYAERMSKRLAGRFGYPRDKPFSVVLHPDRLTRPLQWTKPSRIFVDSMGDLFHKDVPDEYIAAVIGIMAICPQHTFILLTKRPYRALGWFLWSVNQFDRMNTIGKFLDDKAREKLTRIWIDNDVANPAWPLPNVWLGVTVEDQQRADERIPVLLDIPAAKHFISVEPMLGPIDLLRVKWPRKHRVDVLRGGMWTSNLGFVNHSDMERIDWVICGGESGARARPMHPDWARSIRDQCVRAGVPFFFKQWGEWSHDGVFFGDDKPLFEGKIIWNHAKGQPIAFGKNGVTTPLTRPGKKAAGRELDGRTWEEFPESGKS